MHLSPTSKLGHLSFKAVVELDSQHKFLTSPSCLLNIALSCLQFACHAWIKVS